MDDKKNNYIEVAYKLFDTTNGEPTLVEEATADAPYRFISGLGFSLPAFEEVVVDKVNGDIFEFTLTPEQAYGEHEAEHVLDLGKEVFSINGHFDHENIYKDAIIPLQNEDGNRFTGTILEVGEDTVKVDLNHPLAGKTLKFEGTVIENREATNAEIESIVNSMSGEGCGCGCGGDCNCGDNCHCGEEGEQDCGCGCGHKH